MRRNIWLVAGAWLLGMVLAGGAEAATGSPVSLPTPVPQQNEAPGNGTPDTPLAVNSAAQQQVSGAITFARMGAQHGLVLNSQHLQSGVAFTLPHDVIVTHARLDLALRIDNPSSLRSENVQFVLNGQPIGALLLDETTNAQGHYSLDIPASMIASQNNLGIQIKSDDDIINNRWQCATALAANNVVTLLPTSALSWRGLLLDTRKTLVRFPQPFFDNGQMQAGNVTVAYPAQPGDDLLAASAIVASEFGVWSQRTGIALHSQSGVLPENNGVLFGKPGDRIGSVTFPPVAGPTLRLIDNPQNPAYKLLLVSGRNAQEVREAAWRLGQPGLPDSDTLTTDAVIVAPRQPYDAPRWINTRRLVPLREIAPDSASLTSQGVWHGNTNLAFRAAPDLFLWDGQTIPVNLIYHFARKSWLDDEKSFLGVSFNGQFVKRFPAVRDNLLSPVLAWLGMNTRQQHGMINIDPTMFYGDNQLSFYFGLVAQPGTPCQSMADPSVMSDIDGNSTLDLRHAWHFGELPNMGWFASALFPYTRNADLARTVLLLPPQPSDPALSTMLNLMAHAGAVTGVPVNYLNVQRGLTPGSGEALAGDDIIAIVSLAENKPFLQQLLQGSPFRVTDATLEPIPAGWQAQLPLLLQGNGQPGADDLTQYLAENSNWQGFFSYRSPWSAGHVVTLVTATDDEQLAQAVSNLVSPAVARLAAGDVTLIGGNHDVHSWRVAPTFSVGDLPGYLQIFWFTSRHVLLLAGVACLLAAIASGLLFGWLARRGRRRLQEANK